MSTKHLTTHQNPAGYSEGAWEYRITWQDDDGVEHMSFDGGYQSERLAREAGMKAMRELA